MLYAKTGEKQEGKSRSSLASSAFLKTFGIFENQMYFQDKIHEKNKKLLEDKNQLYAQVGSQNVTLLGQYYKPKEI